MENDTIQLRRNQIGMVSDAREAYLAAISECLKANGITFDEGDVDKLFAQGEMISLEGMLL